MQCAIPRKRKSIMKKGDQPASYKFKASSSSSSTPSSTSMDAIFRPAAETRSEQFETLMLSRSSRIEPSLSMDFQRVSLVSTFSIESSDGCGYGDDDEEEQVGSAFPFPSPLTKTMPHDLFTVHEMNNQPKHGIGNGGNVSHAFIAPQKQTHQEWNSFDYDEDFHKAGASSNSLLCPSKSFFSDQNEVENIRRFMQSIGADGGPAVSNNDIPVSPVAPSLPAYLPCVSITMETRESRQGKEDVHMERNERSERQAEDGDRESDGGIAVHRTGPPGHLLLPTESTGHQEDWTAEQCQTWHGRFLSAVDQFAPFDVSIIPVLRIIIYLRDHAIMPGRCVRNDEWDDDGKPIGVDSLTAYATMYKAAVTTFRERCIQYTKSGLDGSIHLGGMILESLAEKWTYDFGPVFVQSKEYTSPVLAQIISTHVDQNEGSVEDLDETPEGERKRSRISDIQLGIAYGIHARDLHPEHKSVADLVAKSVEDVKSWDDSQREVLWDALSKE